MKRATKPTIALLGLLFILFAGFGCPKKHKTVKPETVGISEARLKQVDDVIQNAIENKDIPGAVLLVARHGKVAYRKAYGYAQLEPEKIKMKSDMIFDLASITKPVATASSIMLLVEQGKLRLLDKVKQFVPEFSRYIDEDGTPSEDARIYHLLTHTSGLPPYFNADSLKRKFGYPCSTDTLVRFIAKLPKNAPPGKEFHYSCLGYITLAYIIKKVSGLSVDQFSHEYLFKPLQMKHTGYIPQKAEFLPDENAHLMDYYDKLVPTEVINGKPLRGTVHDPLARLQGGISGNAGLFSTADDLLTFAQMLLNKGKMNKRRIFSHLTVKRMTSIYFRTPESGRGLGWDLESAYSSNGGDLFPRGGFGHTGYTGTSIWIDPNTDTVVILLANRVHPTDDGSVVRLRSLVANVVAAAIEEE